jgi:ribulose-5-phosphate 4-epimerase/fuculose-1-phosphate aldolase
VTTDARVASLIAELVAANRILANANVLDAFGHVSARHPVDPARFLMSRSRSPELVTAADIRELRLDGTLVETENHTPYIERFIHAAIYAARPDILGIVHSHADEVVPFSISRTPLQPVLHTAAPMGANIPVWDIRDQFGSHTNLLVTNLEHVRDLAKRLGAERVVLMRGHGFAAAGRSLFEAVKIALYLPRNAQILASALAIGEDAIVLSDGEIEALSSIAPEAPSSRRAWEYWCAKAGVADPSGGTNP